jgi:hypothetical protein
LYPLQRLQAHLHKKGKQKLAVTDTQNGPQHVRNPDAPSRAG